jgi:hypothetical protein
VNAKFRSFLQICLLCLINAGCNANQPYSKWLNQWLTSPTCQPPCWENIIPGITPREEVFTLLGNNPDIKVLSYPIGNRYDVPEVSWGFIGTDTGGSATGDQATEKLIIEQIQLNVNSENLKLEDVVSSYGWPSHVRIINCFGEFLSKSQCRVDLIYMDSGLVLRLWLPERKVRGVRIQPGSKTGRLIFVVPDMDGYANVFSFNENVEEQILEWIGYEEYAKP